MNIKQVNTLLKDTAYKRVSATEGEEKAALYLKEQCEKLGVETVTEPFEVDGDEVLEARLYIDGREIPCTGYRCCGSWDLEAPFYYMPGKDQASLSMCRGKIVMVDTGVGRWLYEDLTKAGAAGFITFNGDMRVPDKDTDSKELRSYVARGTKLPGVNLHVTDAVKLIERGAVNARIVIRQTEKKAFSRNVVAFLPGQTDEYITLTAHYDTVPLSVGAYDNMTGCIGLLGVMEKAAALKNRRYGMKFIFCGSEERGLLGSKAFVRDHEKELEKCVLNINLDMIGSTMGRFISCVSGPESVARYLAWRGCITGFGIETRTGVYSSDSTPFADKGVPALSFARLAPPAAATIHGRYDTVKLVSARQMIADIDFIAAFALEMACAVKCPVERVIPENVKKDLDDYLGRVRKAK